MVTSWKETYAGGSAEAERLEFDRLSIDIMRAQLKAKKASGSANVDRAFHAKAVLAVENAELLFRDDLPDELKVGFAKPGAHYRATVRISNAANCAGPDYAPDLRGMALRIHVTDDEQHDLLATNFPVSHARNARQFVKFAVATAGGRVSRLVGVVGLAFTLGPLETIRILRNISAARRSTRSVALESYWSRGAISWGDLAVRYLLRPAPGTPEARILRQRIQNFFRRKSRSVSPKVTFNSNSAFSVMSTTASLRLRIHLSSGQRPRPSRSGCASNHSLGRRRHRSRSSSGPEHRRTCLQSMEYHGGISTSW